MLIGHKIHHISQTDSTMSYCKNLAKSGATHGTVVSADFQTVGRGRFQRKWISSSSQNLLLSILLKAGILIESEMIGNKLNYVILGLGINVNHVPEEHKNISKISTSLKHLAHQTFSRSFILKILLQRLNFYYSQIIRGGSLTKEWSDKLVTLGTEIKLTILDNQKDMGVSGIAQSVNEDGSLNIREYDGNIFIASSGEVTLDKP